MKDNYNIKNNPPPLSSEDIGKHKDFDALLNKFNQNGGYEEEESPETGSGSSQALVKYGIGGALALLTAIALFYIFSQNQAPAEDSFLQAPLTLDVPFEEEKVNATEGDSLHFKSGAILVVPAGALLGEDGKTITGEATLAYRELTAPQAQLLAGIAQQLNPQGHLQAASIFELKGEQDGKIISIDPQKPLEFIQNLQEDWPAIAARRYHNNAWMVSTRLKVEAAEVPQKQSEQSMLKKLAELENNTPKPNKPLQPKAIGEDMQPFDMDIKATEFPELLHYAKIIWVAPKKELKDEWFEIEWDNMSIEHKNELEYEFVFEKGDQRIAVEALPQIPYSQRAMEAYQKALIQYNQAMETRKQKIQTELEAWAGLENEDQVPTTQQSKYQLLIEEFGLWTFGQMAETEDLPQLDLVFESKGADLINPKQIFVANKDKQIFYQLKTSKPYAIDLSNSQIWVIDEKRQLWEMIKAKEDKIYMDYSSAEKLLEAVKGELK